MFKSWLLGTTTAAVLALLPLAAQAADTPAQGGDVLLDWSALPTHLDEEQRLSRLTAWVLRADQDGRRYGLLLPQTHIAPELGRDHRDRCLRELALFGIAPEDRA